MTATLAQTVAEPRLEGELMAMACKDYSNLRHLIEEASRGTGYANYLKVRDWVLRVLDRPATHGSRPSSYWQEELAGFTYMLDASPLIIQNLRHHCYHLTGIHEYHYRHHHQRTKGPFEEKLRRLQGGDPTGLLVPEAPELGGFGHLIDGALYNLDTLKFYECLLALEESGCLDKAGLVRFAQADGRRPVVTEIGAGWGGFPYQFKTLFPVASYVIVDLPATMLFSATYLMTLFPQAKVALIESDSEEMLSVDAAAYDFVFVPSMLWNKMALRTLDLCINMVSFQEMTSSQVEAYVSRAAALRCPFFYSLNRDRSPHNEELTSVSEILSTHYELKKYDVLDMPYTQLTAPKKRRQTRFDYQHLVGTLKPSSNGRAVAEKARPGTTPAACPRLRRSKICLGMPLYNETKHLPAALNSLLAQTYEDFRLIVVDDSTTDEPGTIVRSFAAREPRISYFKNDCRKGMIENWRAAFDLAGTEVDYFAWVGDHDLWDPRWLESLMSILDQHEDVVLAYPLTVRISDADERLRYRPALWDTFGLSIGDRVRSICRGSRGCGSLVYGLFRAATLRKVGVFRKVLLPDTMLLMELTLRGMFKQVQEELWFRRHGKLFSVERQKKSLFAKLPWYAHFPWPIVNSLALAWNTVFKPGIGGPHRRAWGLRLTLMHFWSACQRTHKRGEGAGYGIFQRTRQAGRTLYKRAKKIPKRIKTKIFRALSKAFHGAMGRSTAASLLGRADSDRANYSGTEAPSTPALPENSQRPIASPMNGYMNQTIQGSAPRGCAASRVKSSGHLPGETVGLADSIPAEPPRA